MTELSELLFLKPKTAQTQPTSQKEPTTITDGSIPTEPNPKQPLFNKLTNTITLSEKKINSHKIHDKERRAWCRILLEAIRTYGTLLPHNIEMKQQITSEETIHVNVTDNEDQILSEAARILSRKERFNHIH